ncbi:MAG: hypothetical protein JW894_11720 [Bacteroidales bacterium]|nr:hypothetical protein [Bacteroidales bacterium]
MATKASTKKTTAKSASASAKKPVAKKAKISAETIRRKAEEIYLERLNSGKHGDELSDWLEAEKQLNGVK